MGLVLNPLFDGTLSLKNLRLHGCPRISPKFSSFVGKNVKFSEYSAVQSFSQGGSLVADNSKSSPEYEANYCDEGESEVLPQVQTLREIPKKELAAKVVMVRFDSAILLKEELDKSSQSVSNAILTIKYLHESGSKIILVSDWKKKINSKLLDVESAADILSSILQLRVVALHCISTYLPMKMEALRIADIFLLENLSEFKEEVANCLRFAELLSSGVDIFVNDSFSLSHKILASTVAVAHFCSAHVAGFHFEKSLFQLKKAGTTNKKPYIAIIGGGNLYDKAAALQFLASKCWLPVDLGPMSLDEINTLLVKSKKIIWIGPPKFKFSNPCINGASKLAQVLDELSQPTCDVTVVGNLACKAVMVESSSLLAYDLIENASVVWDFFKRRNLPGVMALDRAYPFKIDWSAVYHDPAQPLVVDIGCGNGMFLLGMARRKKDLNFLGLEINKKLVRRCLDSVHQSGISNGHFIATNATTTFRSIVSSYPGELVLVSIQCPNPDFNDPEHRWRMLQRSLVEAVADLLAHDGKVFLQSDIKTVAVRMKELFLKYGRGRLMLVNDQFEATIRVWLEENPFGVRSDWEQHVIDQGRPMYRLMLSKSTNGE
ncbi:phosphoglycerate kinase isoform X3 [Ricinus communis]|uniref:phosphoglycerate kinase isoform X3 n=1 Tax=Ricinus communis TaxID=3988 RepID=UPI00201AC4E6|nr:phosphoglycerate kinase isoform X3 [Ricinus communis]